MKLTWLGHSCFKMESNGYTIILDPYEDGYVPGLAPVRETADAVFCSHEHSDHNGKETVTLKQMVFCLRLPSPRSTPGMMTPGAQSVAVTASVFLMTEPTV